MIPELRHFSYEDRLVKLGLTTLKTRRIRGDLIQQFKIQNRMDKVNWQKTNFIAPSISSSGPAANIRGHKYRINQESDSHPARDNFFLNRIAQYWNKLKEDTIGAKSVNSFKNKIDLELPYIIL
jgi:ribonuclease P/MRP protein subunit RPP40